MYLVAIVVAIVASGSARLQQPRARGEVEGPGDGDRAEGNAARHLEELGDGRVVTAAHCAAHLRRRHAPVTYVYLIYTVFDWYFNR